MYTDPAKVQNLKKKDHEDPIPIFSWDPLHIAPTYYSVEVLTDDSIEGGTQPTNDCFYELKSFKQGVKYSITVTAVNIAGHGQPSDKVDHYEGS